MSLQIFYQVYSKISQTRALFFKLFHCHFVTNPMNSLCTCLVQGMWLDD